MNIAKALLLQKEMTVQELADKAGIKKRALDPYMRDAAEWGNARGKILLAVADALNVDPHLLVDGKAEIKITSRGGSNFIDEFNQPHTQEEKDRIEAAAKLFDSGE